MAEGANHIVRRLAIDGPSQLADPMSTSDNSAALKSAANAAARLFRAYEGHNRAAGPDTLFLLLTAIHSLDDRLQKAGIAGFEKLEEFAALRALRNFAHHQDEITANVCIIPSPVDSDLAFLCLVRREQIERAIEMVVARWRPSVRTACEARFHWYGDAVNINPCLFNFMVLAYEHLVAADVQVDPAAIEAFEASYRFEAREGLPHLIDGRLSAPAGEIDPMLSALVARLPVT